MIPDTPFGRPEDKDIQRQFMKKIRGDKLQAINAECELEICLAFKYGRKQKTTKSRRTKGNAQDEEDGQSMQGQVKMLVINNFDLDRREKLAVMFKQINERWTFEQIKENQPLPDYFFDDGCDLSYIIYQMQKTQDLQLHKFSAQDLLFLEFLCLEGRKHLNQTIIQYYQQNMNFMIEAMKNGLAKIEEKLQTLRSKSNSKGKQRKISNQQPQSELHSMDLIDQKCEGSKEEEESKQKKTKKIKKDKKSKKGKKDEDSEQDQEDGENGNEQNNYPKDKQLALKTCNYIAWAYWYVIKKQ